MRKCILITAAGILFNISSFAQSPGKDNLLWSETGKLTTDDFLIKSERHLNSLSAGQFSMSYQVNGFDFLTKNFNKKVRNYFIRSASWIDTTQNVQQSLVYQQTLFDLCEIYTRQFRKALRENRKQLSRGTKIVEELNDKSMSDFARRRVDYDLETKSGTDEVKQKEWETLIDKELAALADFAFDR
jgi:hypothetical protein